jgi:hypothetical protein
MNITEAIERAIADVLRNQALGDNVLIRCWHNLKKDNAWKPENDRVFPCIQIACSTPISLNGSKVSKSCECTIDIFTNPAADQDHSVISKIESGCQEALESLVDACEAESLAVFDKFESSAKKDYPGVLSINGLEFTDGNQPGIDEGVQSVGLAIIVHYAKSNR